MIPNLPNLLTVTRVAIIPVLVGMFYVEAEWARWALLGLFVYAAVTDWLDGWLARRLDQATSFGRFMDPIADKLLVVTALLMIAAFDRITALSVIAVVLILGREFVISGLREFLADLRVAGLPVSPLAKWKTATQMIAVGLLLLGDGPLDPLPIQTAGEVLLWAAAVLTTVTGWDYVGKAVTQIRTRVTG